jgi:hypothetical protein
MEPGQGRAEMKKRLTVMVEENLLTSLMVLAKDERRELKDQLVIILENAVKMHQGKKAAKKRRQDFRDRYGGA